MNIKAFFLSALLLSLPCLSSLSSALEPGEQAPELAASKWLSGTPMKLSGLNKPCLIGFWASGTENDAYSLRLLAQARRDFAKSGLATAAFISADDKDAPSVAAKFANGPCSFAIDDKGATKALYLGSEAVLPALFLVGADGKIVWQGSPTDLFFILKRHLDGKFSAADARKVQALRKEIASAIAAKSLDKALEPGDALLEILPADYETVKLRLSMYDAKKNSSEAQGFLSRLIEKAPEEPCLHFWKLELMLRSEPKASSAELAKFASLMIERFKDDPETLNNLAWTLVDEAAFGDAPLAEAFKASSMSVALLSASEYAAINKAVGLDTFARLHYSLGLLDKAVELQAQACDEAKDGDDAAQFKKLLDYYKAARALAKVQKP